MDNKDKYEGYSIQIDDVAKFRFELISMIEKVRYSIGEYGNLSSSQIAEKFEHNINSNIK